MSQTLESKHPGTYTSKFPKVESFYPYSNGAVFAQNIFGSLEVMFNEELWKITELIEPGRRKACPSILKKHCAKKGLCLLSAFFT